MAREHEQVVALVVVLERGRSLDARDRVQVADDRGRHVAVPPPAGRAAPRELDVLVVEEQALVEAAGVGEVARRQQHGTAAPREHVDRLVVLTGVGLHVAAVGAVAVGDEDRARVVDDVDRRARERHLEPAGDAVDVERDALAARLHRHGHRARLAGREADLDRRRRGTVAVGHRHTDQGLAGGPHRGGLALGRRLPAPEALAPAAPAATRLPRRPPRPAARRPARRARGGRRGPARGSGPRSRRSTKRGPSSILGEAAPEPAVVLERLDERREPAGLDHDVVVEQRDVVDGPDVAHPEVAAAGEARVHRALDDADDRVAAPQHVDHAVGGRVVDEHDLERRRGPAGGQHAVDAPEGQIAAVVVDDDDADARDARGHAPAPSSASRWTSRSSGSR